MTDRQLAEMMAEALEDAHSLATAWAGYYANADAYGRNGKIHPRHAKILKKAEQALAAFKEAGEEPEYRMLEEGERTRSGDQWSANGITWRNVGRSVIWRAAKCYSVRRPLTKGEA